VQQALDLVSLIQKTAPCAKVKFLSIPPVPASARSSIHAANASNRIYLAQRKKKCFLRLDHVLHHSYQRKLYHKNLLHFNDHSHEMVSMVLTQEYNKYQPSVNDKVVSFWGLHHNNEMFSNFWSCKITYQGITCPSTEHAYQHVKALTMYPALANKILYARTAAQTKILSNWIGCLAQEGKIASSLAAKFHNSKLSLMRDLCRIKFTTHPYLKEALLETAGSTLVEASPSDSFWGGRERSLGPQEQETPCLGWGELPRQDLDRHQSRTVEP